MTLGEKVVFAATIMLNILGEDYPGLNKWVLNPIIYSIRGESMGNRIKLYDYECNDWDY